MRAQKPGLSHTFPRHESKSHRQNDRKTREKETTIYAASQMVPICYRNPITIQNLFSFQLNFQGRVISYKAEGRMHKFKWVYDGTAWDVQSGTSVKAKHYCSTQGAIEHAVKNLIDDLKAKGILK